MIMVLVIVLIQFVQYINDSMIDSMPIELIHLHQDACYIRKTDEKK